MVSYDFWTNETYNYILNSGEPDVISWTIVDQDVKFYNRTIEIYNRLFEISEALPVPKSISDVKPGIPYNVESFQPFPRLLMEHLGYQVPPEFVNYVLGNLRFEVYIRSKYSFGRGLLIGRFFDSGNINIFITRTEQMKSVLEQDFRIEDPKYRLSPLHAIHWIGGKVWSDRGHKIYGPIGVDALSGKRNVVHVPL